MLAFLQIIGGLVLLVGGGDALVKGAVGLANKLGISSIVIGLTVVAFGTSAPEMFISIQSAANHPDIAVGNVIGSNIANILLVIGATTLIMPIMVHRQLAYRDGTVMFAITLLFVVLALNERIGPFEGMVLLLLVVTYTIFTIHEVRHNKAAPELMEGIEDETDVHISVGAALAYCVGGVLMLTFGSDVLIEGSVTMAQRMGLSEAVIGATIIAVGGSTPELVTSLVAALRRHGDIGLANVVGSNIFNLSAVIGMATLFAPLSVAEQFLNTDLRVMLLVTGVFFVAMLTRKQIGRIEGVAMLATYLAYIGWQYNVLV